MNISSDLYRQLSVSLQPLGFSEEDSKFLTAMTLDAYNQKFDNDRVLDDNLEFGFSDIAYILEAYLEEIRGREGDIVDIENDIQNNVIAIIRKNVSVNDYIKNNLIQKDKALYNKLTADNSSEEQDNELIEYINTNNAYKTLVESVCEVVEQEYTCLLQDGYGLTPYDGVIVTDNEHQFTYSVESNQYKDKFKMSAIPNASTAFGDISKLLKEKMGIATDLSRQFNVKRMIKSDIPIYYPKKILEFASGLEPMEKQNKDIYKKHAKSISWGKTYDKDENGDSVEVNGYYDDFIKPYIRKAVYKAICYILESHIDSHVSISQQTNKLGDNSVLHEVQVALNRLQASLCTALVVVKYNNLGNKVNAITLRIIETVPQSLPTDKTFTKLLFGKLSTNKNIEFEDANVISDEIQGYNLAYRVIEYKHDFDSALTNAEPLFGYKAVQMYNERGIELSWNKILLGQDTKGTPIFASASDTQDLPLQSCTVHNMMAGSRAGKGVMTMNILASAIASNRPIFYIDRKPDMAVMFQDLTKGNMFIVNGGQYEAKNDPQGYFSDTGNAIAGWKEAYSGFPDYLKELFNTPTYAGTFGDYVYYRSIMLIMGIIMARVNVPNMLPDLGGKSGIVVVVDEFKNWQTIFELAFFSITGKFCKTENRIMMIILFR